MIPPMSGMQAMAAAIFGGKSIDDGSDPELAAGGGMGGEFGSAGSGIQLLTKTKDTFVKRTSFFCPHKFDTLLQSFGEICPHLSPLPKGEEDAQRPVRVQMNMKSAAKL